MLVKIPIYFHLHAEKNVKITDSSLYIEALRKEVEMYLKDNSRFTLEGNLFKKNRIRADFKTAEEALETLRTKK